MTASVRRLAVAASLGLVAAAVVASPALASPEVLDVAPLTGHKVHYPTVQAAEHARGTARQAAGAAPASQLAYGGGVSGVGVTTGAPLVYLVFWGSQWGTASPDANGDQTFTGDTRKIAPVLQEMFKGIGTSGETWSGVMTQYCEGVAAGSTSCPASSVHVGYPTGGALAGVWYDSGVTAPSTSSDTDIARVALAAAANFGNTSTAANRSIQYVVVSPPGTHPGGYNTPNANWCAWHDWTGDTGLVGTPISSSYHVAFTNLPYIPDMGLSCGANYVNLLGGSLDGVSIVEGHEYAETITDQFPGGGWLDATGYENADKCSWVGTDGTGGAQNVSFGTGRTFPMQGTWSNDSASCRIAHPIVTAGSSNVVTIDTIGAATTVQTHAGSVPAVGHDSAPATLSYSATGLPAGITINAATGLMSGTATTRGTKTVTVTVADGTGATASTSFTWTVTATTVTITQLAGNLVSVPRRTTVTGPTMAGSTTDLVSSALTWSASGLPSGVTLSSAGKFGGRTSRTATTYNVTVTATDGTGTKATYTFQWKVT